MKWSAFATFERTAEVFDRLAVAEHRHRAAPAVATVHLSLVGFARASTDN